MSRSRGISSKIVQLPLFDWIGVDTQLDVTPAQAHGSDEGTATGGPGGILLPPNLWTGALRDLVVTANVDAGNAERFARQYERDPREQDPQVKARFLGLYRQEARFQRLLADQLAEIQAGARAALDLSGLIPQEMEAFRQFLRDEVSRMDLGRTRILHPDYAIRDLSVKQSLLRRCSLKERLCSYLLEHLAGEGTSVELARQVEGG